MITFLNVPFHRIEQAKRLGARFNMARKQWFVPDGVDLIPFLNWVEAMPNLSDKVKKVLNSKIGVLK